MLVKIQEICLNHFPACEDVGKLEWLLGCIFVSHFFGEQRLEHSMLRETVFSTESVVKPSCFRILQLYYIF